MNATESEGGLDFSETKKKPIISLPFIVVAGVLAVAAYLSAPWVMKMVMLEQEKAKARSLDAPAEFKQRPEDLSFGSMSGGGGGNTDDNDQGREGGGGGEGGRRGGGGRGNFDPEAFFSERDVDGDGRLAGDEISERMADRVAEVDTDGDGAISKEEFLAGRANARRGGPGQPGDAPPPADSDSPPSEAPESSGQEPTDGNSEPGAIDDH